MKKIALSATVLAGILLAGHAQAGDLQRWTTLFTAGSEPAASSSADIAAWSRMYSDQPWVAMGVGQPHSPEAMAKAAAVDGKVEAQRAQQLAAWTDLYSRDVYPGMGLVGHGRN
ncbi:MAG: hypothetical protein ACM31L_02940 [Actinomycetota bacterium]